MASKKVIVQTEEIIESERSAVIPQDDDSLLLCRCRRARALWRLSWHVPGVYVADTPCITEAIRALDSREEMQRYLETYVYRVESFADMLEQRVESALAAAQSARALPGGLL
jgi:hypothetical protein